MFATKKVSVFERVLIQCCVLIQKPMKAMRRRNNAPLAMEMRLKVRARVAAAREEARLEIDLLLEEARVMIAKVEAGELPLDVIISDESIAREERIGRLRHDHNL